MPLGTGMLLTILLILVGAVILVLRKEGGTEEIIKDLFSSRTIFALMMYGTFAYLAISGKIEAIIVSNIVFSLMSFYFGMKVGQQTNGGNK